MRPPAECHEVLRIEEGVAATAVTCVKARYVIARVTMLGSLPESITLNDCSRSQMSTRTNAFVEGGQLPDLSDIIADMISLAARRSQLSPPPCVAYAYSIPTKNRQIGLICGRRRRRVSEGVSRNSA